MLTSSGSQIVGIIKGDAKSCVPRGERPGEEMLSSESSISTGINPSYISKTGLSILLTSRSSYSSCSALEHESEHRE